jgi:hypothetical protein
MVWREATKTSFRSVLQFDGMHHRGSLRGNKDGFQQMIEVDMYAVVKKTPSPTVMVPPGHPRGWGREGYRSG